VKLLGQIPAIGPIRSALLVAILQTPHRFRTKRQLWAYSGFAVQTYDSGEYRFVRGRLQRNCERITVRGLNRNHNHDLKNLLKGRPSRPSNARGRCRIFVLPWWRKGCGPVWPASPWHGRLSPSL
jgi:transposase